MYVIVWLQAPPNSKSNLAKVQRMKRCKPREKGTSRKESRRLLVVGVTDGLTANLKSKNRDLRLQLRRRRRRHQCRSNLLPRDRPTDRTAARMTASSHAHSSLPLFPSLFRLHRAKSLLSPNNDKIVPCFTHSLGRSLFM